MIRQTSAAGAQIDALLRHFIGKDRPEAYARLLQAIENAVARIEANPRGGAPYPSPYRGVRKWGYRWIKEHRYWFGWSTVRDYPVITNVIFETSDIRGRIEPDSEELEDFRR
ncbi:MAG TPA: hypothetical protein VKS60_07980 [Stellaceae bacterium]|nr:hypothetical protein [Stellaceae bacterium]